MPHNDDGIVIEDALDIVGTLQREGCLIVFKEGGDDHTDAVVPATGLTVEDVIAGGFVETKGDGLDELVGTKGKGNILDKRAVVVLESELHWYATTDDAAVELVEMQLGLTKDSSCAVVDKSGEHIVTLFGKETLNVTISLVPDSVDHLFNR